MPGSTWHRLVTDDAGEFLDLSTTSYSPTPPIWRYVVARDRVCIAPGCSRASVLCECDHRVPHPVGLTCTSNLWPVCRRHHKVKHSLGVEFRIDPDGTCRIRSRHGVEMVSHRSEQPLTT